jgi:hypothetical protein
MQVCCGSLAKDALARHSGKIHKPKFWVYPCEVWQGLEQQSLISIQKQQAKKHVNTNISLQTITFLTARLNILC